MEETLKACVKDLLVREKNMANNTKLSKAEMSELITEKRELFTEVVHRWVHVNDRRLLAKVKQILSKANGQWKSQNENVNHSCLKNLLNELGVAESKALDTSKAESKSHTSSRNQTPIREDNLIRSSEPRSDSSDK